MLNKTTMLGKIKEIKALEEQKKVIEEQLESLKGEIKEELDRRHSEELQVATFIIRYTNISSSRFDTKRFKDELGENLYKKYCKEVLSRRFTIS